jgi:hypothetical protein
MFQRTLSLGLILLGTDNVDACSFALDWYPEPEGQRVINQCDLTGILKNDSSDMDVTQTFTVTTSGALSSIGSAISAGGASVTTSMYRVTDGNVGISPIATSFLDASYFATIGPRTTPVWGYAEFEFPPEVMAGEQIAFRIQSSFAELWTPRRDALPSGDLIEFPGTDLAFRAYVIPEPATGLHALIGSVFCAVLRRRASWQ